MTLSNPNSRNAFMRARDLEFNPVGGDGILMPGASADVPVLSDPTAIASFRNHQVFQLLRRFQTQFEENQIGQTDSILGDLGNQQRDTRNLQREWSWDLLRPSTWFARDMRSALQERSAAEGDFANNLRTRLRQQQGAL